MEPLSRQHVVASAIVALARSSCLVHICVVKVPCDIGVSCARCLIRAKAHFGPWFAGRRRYIVRLVLSFAL